ncbi:MAG: hypothetical protein V4547_20180 [Bacteroidota bacterium]
MTTKTFILTTFILTTNLIYGQGSSKITREFGSPIISDSSSTFIIPTVYNAGLFSSSKLALWGDFYSNVIFYNFKTDSSKKLFEKDTYIVSLNKVNYSYYSDRKPGKSLTANFVFYRIMNIDRNKNGHIDSEDPAILYVTDTHGNNLKSLTGDNENIVGFDIYEKQNIALVKMQRDFNNDGNFNSKDTDYYYVKLDLDTLVFGKKIELK